MKIRERRCSTQSLFSGRFKNGVITEEQNPSTDDFLNNLCHEITLPPLPIGNPAPGTSFKGGVYVGIMPDGSGKPAYHLIVATGSNAEAIRQWGPGDISISDANSEWDGQENSQAIVDKKLECPATEFCIRSEHEGYSDWYLPSLKELLLCYTNVSNLFTKTWYWSSTQHSDVYAWQFGFHNGRQSYATKWTNGYIRLVRRVEL